MSLINDFLLNSTLSDEEYGKEAARIILTTLLRQKIDVVDITPQKVYNGLNKSKHGIRLDAYITAGFNAYAKNGGNKPFMGRVVSDLHLVYTF